MQRCTCKSLVVGKNWVHEERGLCYLTDPRGFPGFISYEASCRLLRVKANSVAADLLLCKQDVTCLDIVRCYCSREALEVRQHL